MKPKPVATKSITSTWTVTVNPLYRLRYHAQYDIPEAKLREWYSLWYKRIGWRGKVTWKPYKDYTYIGAAEGMKNAITGNYAWAKQLSEDLNIELPEPTHRLSTWSARAVKAKRGVTNPPKKGAR